MKKNISLIAVALVFSSALFGGTPNWSTNFSGIKWADPMIYNDGTNYLVSFTLKTVLQNSSNNWPCGPGVPSNTNITLRTPLGDAGLAQVKSWQAALLTAISGGKSVRILFDGDLCLARDFIICSDATLCPAPN